MLPLVGLLSYRTLFSHSYTSFEPFTRWVDMWSPMGLTPCVLFILSKKPGISCLKFSQNLNDRITSQSHSVNGRIMDVTFYQMCYIKEIPKSNTETIKLI